MPLFGMRCLNPECGRKLLLLVPQRLVRGAVDFPLPGNGEDDAVRDAADLLLAEFLLESASDLTLVDGRQPLPDCPACGWPVPALTLAHRVIARTFQITPCPRCGQAPSRIVETVDRVALVTGPDARLRRFAVFDVVANNADRKVGHLLPMPDGHIYGVDHGICFHEEPKLRTVLWGWRGRALAADELDILERLRDGLGDTLADALAELLTPAEVAATAARVDALLRSRRFPYPHPDWPALPWPPY